MLGVVRQAESCVLWGSGIKAPEQQRKSLSISWKREKHESREEKPGVFSAVCGNGLGMKLIKKKEGDTDPG